MSRAMDKNNSLAFFEHGELLVESMYDLWSS